MIRYTVVITAKNYGCYDFFYKQKTLTVLSGPLSLLVL